MIIGEKEDEIGCYNIYLCCSFCGMSVKLKFSLSIRGDVGRI